MIEVFAEHGKVSFCISRKLVHLFNKHSEVPVAAPSDQGKWLINEEPLFFRTQFSGPFLDVAP